MPSLPGGFNLRIAKTETPSTRCPGFTLRTPRVRRWHDLCTEMSWLTWRRDVMTSTQPDLTATRRYARLVRTTLRVHDGALDD